MEKNEAIRREQQKHMAGRLKAVTIAIGILGAIFFLMVLSFRGYILWDRFNNVTYEAITAWDIPTKILSTIHFIFSFAVIAGCYAILFYFWKVTDEIGRDNSFSEENSALFHRMARIGRVIWILYAARSIFLFANMAMGFPIYRYFTGWNKFDAAVADIAGFGYSVVMTIVFILFAVIADALSTLIGNAYLVKAENDLTI